MADTRRPVHDQVVIILGAASGIGRATALEFARRARPGSSSPPRAPRPSPPWSTSSRSWAPRRSPSPPTSLTRLGGDGAAVDRSRTSELTSCEDSLAQRLLGRVRWHASVGHAVITCGESALGEERADELAAE